MEKKHPLKLILDNIKSKQSDMKSLDITYNFVNLSLYYLSSTSDLKHFNDHYLPRINQDTFAKLNSVMPGLFFTITEYTEEYATYLLNKGNLIIIINDEVSYNIELSKIPKRNTSKSELDPLNLLDSHDGFVEKAEDNLALIRKRLKNNNIVVEQFILGKKTQTDVYVIYLEEHKNDKYIKQINDLLDNYPSDYLTNINDLNNVFNESKLLPTVFNTSSPDYAVGSILEGRAAIIIDNSPIASILPTSLSMFTTTKNESNAPKYYTFFSRIFTIIFFFISIFSIGLIISLLNFNPTFFSTLFIANLRLTERGTTFPLFIESIIILFLFEFFRIISSRSPNNYVQNIIVIFSGLFIGQNAISSGVVGSSFLLIISISYVSSFAITNNQHLITSLDIFRLYNLVLSYTFGILGFVIGLITTFAYFGTQKSVGNSLFSPFTPLEASGIKNFFFPSHGVKQ